MIMLDNPPSLVYSPWSEKLIPSERFLEKNSRHVEGSCTQQLFFPVEVMLEIRSNRHSQHLVCNLHNLYEDDRGRSDQGISRTKGFIFI